MAVTTIGGLLYGVLNKKSDWFSLNILKSSPPSPQPNSTAEALPTSKPSTTAPESSSPQLAASPTPTALESSSPQAKSDTEAQRLQEITAPASPPATVKPTAPTPTPIVEFSDVPEEFWAHRFMGTLSKRGIVVGFPDRTFKPDKLATRAELAAMLKKLGDRETRKVTNDFKDLSPSYWATDAIKEVSQTGVLQGYPGEVFRPNQPVTRAQALIALATALNLGVPSSPEKTLQIYKDRDQVPDYAIPKVAAATKAGLVVGYPDEALLIPNKPATRAEVAAMVYQALVTKILDFQNL